MTPLLQAQLALYQGMRADADELSADFRCFIRAAWKVLEPGPLTDEWYIDAIADHCAAWARGEIHSLMIHLRPRMAKTIIYSVMLDAWIWTWAPHQRVLSASYGDDRRKDDCKKTRQLIQSPWYRARWPHVQIQPSSNEQHRFTLVPGGHRYTAIYGTGATGDGGDLQRLDDAQSAADQSSPTKLQHDITFFYDTWDRRGNVSGGTPSMIGQQRLGPYDLCNALRVDDPNRWEVLALETRRSIHTMIPYYRHRPDGSSETVMLPRVDTALSRDGRYVDPRQAGELISSRVKADRLNILEARRPAEYAAQEDNAPILSAVDGAKLYLIDRARHFKSFASRMAATSLQQAIRTAQAQGWQVGLGMDHGIQARRECATILIWSARLREAWVVGYYQNSERTDARTDARAIRNRIDTLEIQIRSIVRAVGDVGNIGKGADVKQGEGQSINVAMMQAVCEGSKELCLPFQITTPDKRVSVAIQAEDLNTCAAAGGLYIDDSCLQLMTAIEGWTGTEHMKDPIDSLRYIAHPVVRPWVRDNDSGIISA